MATKIARSAWLALSLFPALAMASHWSYEGEGAPEHWGSLDPDFSLCQKGMNQSPIDIDNTLKAHVVPLNTHYIDGPSLILNNGHTIQATMPPTTQDSVTIDGTVYALQQLHFHAPSENTLHGKHYDLEMHLVHKNAAGEIAVVAVMFKTGAANIELAKLWQAMPDHADASQPLKAAIDINRLLPKDKTYYRFSGSLTTPPCSEGVSWLVMKHPLTLSAEQLNQFKQVMHHDNNRPVQPLHGRIVVE
ncbi:Carbonic anhydrase [Cronobacter universalis NCTC 9529]|uniref:Carbonic anhydrase n=1 Tax=Cronobacter universalis NCTC 9529 TaxID=1074000 RepID=A0AAC8ZQN1_9ENTR|nr:carbonic anhydrase family protein [Cronobacter universalis]ALB53452.1 carbonic anhydrase [Cronobacter universalis NCTC 9529]CCK17057.1 Carbonic anhydrase [Cronobacter universalis NCTC 9529]STC98135.1 Carbonic anhydrase precursor [Cronobacter universalis NCTC 9529]